MAAPELNLGGTPHDSDAVQDTWYALKEMGFDEYLDDRMEYTPFGAQKTAELEVQLAIDPTYGLSRQRYGWYSNLELFNDLHFTEGNGQIEIETSATATDTAEIRSAYPGQYVAHTLAEPGMGVQIPEQYLEYDTSGTGETVSLTHGEISLGLMEVNRDTQSGVNTLALSFESDAVYAQIRKNNTDIVKVPQQDWNIDPMDGTGPSGKVLRPETGYVYNFPFTWYGQGALMFAIQDNESGTLLPMHWAEIDGASSLGTPNMPVEVAVQNLGTAQPLGCNVGGMQFATHGTASINNRETGRQNEITRQTSNSYIDQSVVVSNEAIDPFGEAGRPLMSVRRDMNNLDSRTALGVEITDFYINSGGDLYIAVFDEWNEETALTNQNFRNPNIQQDSRETRMQVDTSATDYTPSADSVLRGLMFVKGEKNSPDVITGDASSRLPIDATCVVTAILPPGGNSTYAQPALLTSRESF